MKPNQAKQNPFEFVRQLNRQAHVQCYFCFAIVTVSRGKCRNCATKNKKNKKNK